MSVKTIKKVEDAQYMVLGLFIIAQAIIGINFWIGESLYLIGDMICIARNQILNRPRADKIKDYTLTTVTIGIMIFNFLVK